MRRATTNTYTNRKAWLACAIHLYWYHTHKHTHTHTLNHDSNSTCSMHSLSHFDCDSVVDSERTPSKRNDTQAKIKCTTCLCTHSLNLKRFSCGGGDGVLWKHCAATRVDHVLCTVFAVNLKAFQWLEKTTTKKHTPRIATSNQLTTSCAVD